MDDETISRVILITIAHHYANDEGELLSIADTLWEWCAGEVVIEFTPEPEG